MPSGAEYVVCAVFRSSTGRTPAGGARFVPQARPVIGSPRLPEGGREPRTPAGEDLASSTGSDRPLHGP